MRVLVVNKFWYLRGGLERVMFDELTWLADAGHDVAHFSTTHPKNVDSPWSSYFAPYIELGESAVSSPVTKAVAALRMFENRQAARRFSSLLDDFRPDVVHVHGIHRQISPSILDVAAARRVPVVQTVHDHHHVCPADILLRPDSELCQPRLCGRWWYGPAVRNRCVRGDLAASALSAAETSWSRLLGRYERGISRFICPSEFVASVLKSAAWSVPTDVVPNAVGVPSVPGGGGTGFAVIGRVVPEKGVATALEAARVAGVDVTVAGDGPQLPELRRRFPEVRFVGHLGAPEMRRLVESLRAVIVPSLWFENAPMSALEAMAAGVPVIASDLGGLPEIVTHGVSGLLCVPGDVASFASALSTLKDDIGKAAEMGECARAEVSSRFSPEAHLTGILNSYRLAGAGCA